MNKNNAFRNYLTVHQNRLNWRLNGGVKKIFQAGPNDIAKQGKKEKPITIKKILRTYKRYSKEIEEIKKWNDFLDQIKPEWDWK